LDQDFVFQNHRSKQHVTLGRTFVAL